MAEPPLRRLRSCALAIICARPKEATIISSMLETSTTISGDSVDGVDNGHEFMLGEMKIATGKDTFQMLKFYVTSSLSQGLVPFAISAGALISVLKPRFAIHAGICAGNGNLKNAKKPDEGTITSVTDVIITDEAMSIESGKFTSSSFLPEYRPHHLHVAGLEAFAEATETVTNTKSKVHYGPFLSSSAVRENAPEIFERIRTTVNRKVLALDMEASAFLELCAHYKHTNVRTLGVFKGVSDVGDENKRDDFQKEALRNTGTVLSEWIHHTFRSRTWEADNSAEMGTRLAKNYYQNFISHVLNAVSGGMPTSEIEGGFKGFSSGEVPSMMIVMPPENRVTYFAHQGQLQGIVESHGLQDVKVGRGAFTRTAFFKGRYLIDFPRTLNDLIDSDEPHHQASLFEKHLLAQPFFDTDGRPARSVSAEVVSWKDFVKRFPATTMVVVAGADHEDDAVLVSS